MEITKEKLKEILELNTTAEETITGTLPEFDIDEIYSELEEIENGKTK